MDHPTAHALLRDRRQWRGSFSGLAIADDASGGGDGELVLARVPAPQDGKPVVLPLPAGGQRQASGIALGPCQALFVADTAHDRVLYVDGTCGAQAWLPAHTGRWPSAPGQFRTPRGLACADDALLVADSGNARVQRLAWPALEAHAEWPAWAEPVALAVDSLQRVLVIDAAGSALHRVRADGAPDAMFDAAVAASGRLQRPLFVAVGPADRVLVADTARDEVVVFTAQGAFLHTLAGPAGWQPGAIAVSGDRTYVADAASGGILVFQGSDAPSVIGRVHGWHGPVTALAAAADGSLYIKPGLDAAYHRFAADAAFLAQGQLEAGPFDAGELYEWERACTEVELPSGTTITCELAVGATAAPPASTDWVALPSHDALLALCTPAGRRHAWLRLRLASADAGSTPRLRQVRLVTAAEDYLDYLPQTYRLNDQPRDDEAWRRGTPAVSPRPDGFLSRWMGLVRGEFGRIEAAVDGLPRVADPDYADPQALVWLAQWFGLELPLIADAAQRRALVGRAVALMGRRGTPESIAEFVELHTGIRPVIFEAASERRIWMLDRSGRLDFDTRLAPLDPQGMVVPDPQASQGCCPATPPDDGSGTCSPCAQAPAPSAEPPPLMPIGRAVVGEAGPLAEWQVG
ncbi:MAG: putative rane protein, partial [Ramlibacter sp.]|nr:putative rane protein [Ramlibacter sp.]